uniref:WWE domain-containing protein n=1 Tax=Heliothis virescens TaxID=7102 RepID=A0A2A4K2J3_HELVI
MTSTVSKASSKSDDDFDVNEYFARLHGTRYVSAPINSNPDQNANLSATEDNLEEINLNDDKNVDVQQSLTADIAQNFSQLPTVLPHVASAVFSSFSNMLSYKSREQTPDEKPQGFQEVPFQSQGSVGPGFVGQDLATPIVAEQVVKEVAPPPKDSPGSGSSNFRITTKKKYAQIPGLSSGHNFETSQKIELNPLAKNATNFFVPSREENIVTEPFNPAQDNINATETNAPKIQETYNIFNPLGDNKPSEFNTNAFTVPSKNEAKSFEERLPPPPSYASHDTAASNAIPPPPMFSSQRNSSQTVKSVLPPSVARRIGSNHPVIKPKAVQSITTENIFVPSFDPMNYPSAAPAQAIGSFSNTHSLSAFSAPMFGVDQPIESQEQTNIASIPPPAQFTQPTPPEFATPPLAPPPSVIAPPSKAPARLPPQNLASPPSNIMPPSVAAPPMFGPTFASNPSTFAPSTGSVDGKPNASTDYSIPPMSNIFPPTTQATAQPIQPPGPIQPPPIGSTQNIGPSSFFTPSSSNVASSFYSAENVVDPPQKPLMEPPKATGAVNFRMNKKRPQYYSGPIEGVGSISNSVKPVIPSVDSGSFQGALFTPEQQTDQNVPSSMPFDLSKPVENVPLVPQFNVANASQNVQPPAAFDITQPAAGYSLYDNDNVSYVQHTETQYNTAFDLSRPTTDNYNQQEEPKESKGFGIIGSLKSKLSSIDINKIQHSVTTFFDPAYNASAKDENTAQVAQQNAPYSNAPYDAQSAQTNLDMFSPSQQSSQPYTYDFQQHQNAVYLNNEYYKYPNFQNQGQPLAGHCSNSHHYPSHSSHPKPYDNPHGYPDQAANAHMYTNPASNIQQQDALKPTNQPAAQEPITAKTFKETQDYNAERKMDENVARAGPEVARLVQSTTSIEEKFATNFFDMGSVDIQKPLFVPKADVPANVTDIPKADLFGNEKHVVQDTKPDPILMFDPKTVNLFAKLTVDNKDTEKDKTSTENAEKESITAYGAQSVDLFAIRTNDDKPADLTTQLFSNASADKNDTTLKPEDVIKADNLFSSPVFDSKDTLAKDSLLNTLSKDDVPILGVSSVPLFGLSTILADKSKEFNQGDVASSLSDRNSSMSFFDHTQKAEDYGAKNADPLNRNASFSFFENLPKIQKGDDHDYDKKPEMLCGKSSASFFENVDANQEIKLESSDNKNDIENETANVGTETQDDKESVSELSICETCREVNKPDDKDDDQDVTNQLIENITSPIQLSNPVEALLPEDSITAPTNVEQVKLDAGQFEEISHITEETIETIQVQSATELLEDVDEIKSMNYGWTESALKQDYNFNIDPNPIGFIGCNSLFFDKVPTNADEIKHHEDMLVRQLSAPSAPPAEDEEDSKSDEAGILDVHSIEQDANKDFPIFEEFVIEPENDDDKDFSESSEKELDSFTNRVEKAKKIDLTEPTDHQKGLFFETPAQPISMVSYFDTGNYAVETHYRNTNTRPAPTLTIPPGFEEDFKRRVALAKQREEKLRKEMTAIPDTSTQTKTTSVATYCSSRIAPSFSAQPIGFNVEANITSLVDDQSEPSPEFEAAPGSTLRKKDDEHKKLKDLPKDFVDDEEENLAAKLPDIPDVFSFKSTKNEPKLPEFPIAPGAKIDDKSTKLPDLSTAFAPKIEDKLEPTLPAFTAFSVPKEEKAETKLPDPINFFSDNAVNPSESFSRLASYFSSPPKTEHAKSFFELSQSQNHYRHASEQNSKIIDLMKDLTSVQNLTVTKEQTIRHVNYFTVEYDAVLPDFNKGDIKERVELVENCDALDLDSVLTNCRYCSKIFDNNFKVRTAVNENSDHGNSSPPMEPAKETARGSVTVNFDGMTIHEESNEDIAALNENRAATEYTPVKHHWFYRVDVEDKSIWRGFSVADSRALETAYLNPDLNEQTLVPTDGGRYDVNVVGRLRIPVYWTDKPTNVRRCSWFYKGTTDARYVPYTEPVAEKLEEEYRHGMTTSEWHRRLVLPNGEVVVMHGPAVMVHFLHSDAFSTPPQSSSRPRVVRRGHDESEIEDTEPSSIDHLLLLCHGVGSACDMRFRSVEEVVEDFRATSLQLIQSHYRNSYDQGVVSRVEVLPISWHATLHSGETGVDRRLSQITLDSIPRLRNFTNDTVLDVLFYTSPVFCQTILDTVCKELNRIYEIFLQRNPTFKGGVSLGGHSLGSVILYDLLCHQAEPSTEDSSTPSHKNYVKGPAGTGQPCVNYPQLAFAPAAMYALGSPIGQPCVNYPQLAFAPAAMYALGSPIAIFECIRGVESLGASFSLPTCKNFFNIFHPYDPIAYRIEPLINPVLRDLKPYLIPHHKGRKRMHLELKDTMARVGADLKQKLLESLRSTWNKWKTAPPTDGQLEKVVEEEIEKEQLTDESKEELARESELSKPEKLGRLNNGRRVDYVLQEAPLEMINEYLFAMSSHVGYWESEDTMLLMLREIYDALGVQPDCTVPQQNLTVQRTRTVTKDETIVISSDYPSTSRGAI